MQQATTYIRANYSTFEHWQKSQVIMKLVTVIQTLFPFNLVSHKSALTRAIDSYVYHGWLVSNKALIFRPSHSQAPAPFFDPLFSLWWCYCLVTDFHCISTYFFYNILIKRKKSMFISGIICTNICSSMFQITWKYFILHEIWQNRIFIFAFYQRELPV